LADASSFAGAAPEGFLVGELAGEPAATFSVVNYDERFSFVGFYIVRSDLRGRGLGLNIWQEGMARAGSGAIGLDGVVAQQENYCKSGRRSGQAPPLRTAPEAIAGRIAAALEGNPTASARSLRQEFSRQAADRGGQSRRCSGADGSAFSHAAPERHRGKPNRIKELEVPHLRPGQGIQHPSMLEL
jgi:hypothetical protein